MEFEKGMTLIYKIPGAEQACEEDIMLFSIQLLVNCKMHNYGQAILARPQGGRSRELNISPHQGNAIINLLYMLLAMAATCLVRGPSS